MRWSVHIICLLFLFPGLTARASRRDPCDELLRAHVATNQNFRPWAHVITVVQNHHDATLILRTKRLITAPDFKRIQGLDRINLRAVDLTPDGRTRYFVMSGTGYSVSQAAPKLSAHLGRGLRFQTILLDARKYMNIQPYAASALARRAKRVSSHYGNTWWGRTFAGALLALDNTWRYLRGVRPWPTRQPSYHRFLAKADANVPLHQQIRLPSARPKPRPAPPPVMAQPIAPTPPPAAPVTPPPPPPPPPPPLARVGSTQVKSIAPSSPAPMKVRIPDDVAPQLLEFLRGSTETLDSVTGFINRMLPYALVMKDTRYLRVPLPRQKALMAFLRFESTGNEATLYTFAPIRTPAESFWSEVARRAGFEDEVFVSEVGTVTFGDVETDEVLVPASTRARLKLERKIADDTLEQIMAHLTSAHPFHTGFKAFAKTGAGTFAILLEVDQGEGSHVRTVRVKDVYRHRGGR